MAYIKGYDRDIFISYAHNDNARMGTQEHGWVSVFERDLMRRLVQYGMGDFDIWFDGRELGGNTKFNTAIEEGLTKVAFLFILFSHSYQKSDYCRQEREWFCEYAKRRPYGLQIGNHHRIFPILLHDIPHTKWPKEMEGLSAFKLHDANGDPTSQSDPLYLQQLNEVVKYVKRTVDELQELEAESGPEPIEERSGPTVFLADVHDDLGLAARKMRTGLQERGIEVLSPLPADLETEAHREAVQGALKEASASIHLLGRSPGKLMIDSDGYYPHEQAKLALENQRRDCKRIFWIDPQLKLEDVADEAYREFLDKLMNGERGELEWQCTRSAVSGLVSEIYDEVKVESVTAAKGDLSILVDTSLKDSHVSFKLADYLQAKDVKVTFNQESYSPAKSLENFEASLEHVKRLVVIFGRVKDEWLINRCQMAAKAVMLSDRPSLEDGQLYIYRTHDAPELPEFPNPHHKGMFKELHDSGEEGVGLESLAPLLASSD